MTAGIFTDAKLKIWSWRSWYVYVSWSFKSSLINHGMVIRPYCWWNQFSTAWDVNRIANRAINFQFQPVCQNSEPSTVSNLFLTNWYQSGKYVQHHTFYKSDVTLTKPPEFWLKAAAHLSKRTEYKCLKNWQRNQDWQGCLVDWVIKGKVKTMKRHGKHTISDVCLCVCVDVKKPRACWIGLHFPKFPYCKPQSPFYQTRKRGRTTWYKPVFSIKDFKMILQMDYSVRICAYFVWRLESQSWIHLWRIVPWSINTLGVSGQHRNTPHFSERKLRYQYKKYTYVYTRLNRPNVYLGQQKTHWRSMSTSS